MRGPGLALISFVLLTLGVANAWATDRWLDLPTPPAMPEPVKSGMAPVNGIEMYYAVFGPEEGTPILLIHGGLGYAGIWANQVADLSRDHRVIVADSRGHGRSTRNKEPFGYDLMASDYLALLDTLGVPKVSLVGWSDGAIIGFDIAMHHPDRLEKLFAHAGNVTVDGVMPSVETNKTFLSYIDKMGEVYRKISPTPDQYDAFVAQISQMWATQPNWTASELKTIHTPTAIVLGDHDEAISMEHTTYIAKTIPGATLVILKGLSHFAMLQDPDAYTAAIRDFLDRP